MKKLITLLSVFSLAVSALAGPAKIADISHAELQAAIAAKSVVVLDVNGSESFAEGRIPGAIDFAKAKSNLAASLPKDKSTLVVAYCGSERCSAYKAGANAALALGYTNVKHYAPGISGWMKSGAKVEKS
ncbi:MAG: sulfurtransferase [Opitutia bacterium]|nr:MAG: sulfurtransferase [Opitutae bacterium]